MVPIRRKRCSHESCTVTPYFNVEGSKTPAYCRQHTEDGMVNVCTSRHSHETCLRRPSFNYEGSQTEAYCGQHAPDGMNDTMVVDVHSTRFSDDASTRQASRGKEADGAWASCSDHESDMVDGVMTNYIVQCNVAGCETVSAGGLSGEQASHCCHHGPLEDDLTLAVRSNDRKSVAHCSSHRAVGGGSCRLKVEGYL